MDEGKKEKSTEVSAEPQSRIASIDIIEAVHDHADVAFGFIEKHEGFVFTEAQDRAVLRKIDLHIMPLVRLCLSHICDASLA
jgi:hypothetical protein